MLTIQQFCDKHDACSEGRNWALDNCDDMADAWIKLKPEWLLWVATRRGVLTEREFRLFAAFCVRQVNHLLKDERSRIAVEVAEQFANGEASQEELAVARAAGAAVDAARAAAVDAARAAGAAEDAAWDAADAAWAATRVAQAEWLRANTSPKFD